MEFFTKDIFIKNLKRQFMNASIASRIDSYLCDVHIFRPVLLVFVKQKLCIKDLAYGAIHVFSLTINLRMVSKYFYSICERFD